MDEFEQVAAELRQNGSAVVFNKSASESATPHTTASRRDLSQPSPPRSRPRHPHRLRPCDVFARSKNNVCVLCSLETASADPSLSASIHFADARGQSGAQQARLRQRCSGRPSSLLDAQATVSPECVSSTDLSASPLRPHLWWTGIITLASCPGTYWVKNCGPGLQGSEWTGTTLSWSAHPCRRSARSARSAFRQLEPSSHSTCQAVYGRHPSLLCCQTSDL